jgi:hypothetical protein
VRQQVHLAADRRENVYEALIAGEFKNLPVEFDVVVGQKVLVDVKARALHVRHELGQCLELLGSRDTACFSYGPALKGRPKPIDLSDIAPCKNGDDDATAGQAAHQSFALQGS